MNWSHQQKELKTIKQTPTINDILLMIRAIQDSRNRALAAIVYLTAGRISEIVGSLKPKDISEQIINGKKAEVLRLINRKNKRRLFKDVIIPCDKEAEATILNFFIGYIDGMDMEETIFTFTKTRAYQILKKELGYNPHWLRHLRLTHLVINYNFNDQMLIKFAGWSDSRTAKNYMELKVSDLMSAFYPKDA